MYQIRKFRLASSKMDITKAKIRSGYVYLSTNAFLGEIIRHVVMYDSAPLVIEHIPNCVKRFVPVKYKRDAFFRFTQISKEFGVNSSEMIDMCIQAAKNGHWVRMWDFKQEDESV